MDFHVLTPHGSELIAQVTDGQLVFVPPSLQPGEHPANDNETRAVNVDGERVK